MLIVLSPAKSLDYHTPLATDKHSKPDFIKRSAELVEILRAYSPAQLASLMRISDPLAALNSQRFADWSRDFPRASSRPAALTFNGDVYGGLDAPTLDHAGLDYLQRHLRILSGLYGVLRPLDLMQAYRLEMGTRLANPQGKDLYAFWGDAITEAIAAAAKQIQARVLVNLASEEYFKAVRPAHLPLPVITPVFEEWKGGVYKIISFHAKRARGLMTRFAAEHGLTDAEGLKAFDVEGYAFDAKASAAGDGSRWHFRRRQ